MASKFVHEQCFKFNTEVNDIQKCLACGHKIMVLLRGVSGSGKTMMATKLVEAPRPEGSECSYLSLDLFKANHLVKAVRESIFANISLIVIDTENIERVEIKKFSELAITEGIEVYVIEPDTTWKYDAYECKRRSARDEDIVSIQNKINYIKTTPLNDTHLANPREWIISIKNKCDSKEEYTPLTPPSLNDTPAGSPTGSIVFSPNTIPSTTSTTSLLQMFSLAHTPKTKTMRTVGTNVTIGCLAVELAGFNSTKTCGCFLEKEETVRIKEGSNVRMIDRKTETEPFEPLLSGRGKELEFSLLTLIFPRFDTLTLRHQLQLNSYSETFQLIKILGETPCEPKLLLDHSALWYELEDEESVTFYSNNGIEEELQQMMNQRKELHFDENIYIPEETENDEEIARILHSQINANDSNHHPQDDFHSNIAFLAQMFHKTDRAMICGAFEASGGNLETARGILRDYGEDEVTASAGIRTWSQTTATPKPVSRQIHRKTKEEENNHFLKRTGERPQVLLQTVQAEAMHLRRKLDSERLSSSSYNPSASKEFRQDVMRERATRLKNGITAAVKEIDEKIRNAHSNPWNLDLHFMSVEGAEKLVLDAIAAVRFYIRTSRCRGRMVVVTGYGNNSRNGAKIKPSIEALLRNRKIPFESVNEGCIEVKIK